MNGNTLILDSFWVDNKPFPTELSPASGDGRAFYDYYYGNAKYLGWMDLVLLKELIKKHSIHHIILQNMDTLGKIADATGVVKVCVAYESNRFIVCTPQKKNDPLHCKPVYEHPIIGGWELSENDTSFPTRVESYVRYLLVHTRIDSITCMTNNAKLTAHFDLLGHVVLKTEQIL